MYIVYPAYIYVHCTASIVFCCVLNKQISISQAFELRLSKSQQYILQERLERMNSATALETALPRKVLLEQLSRILPADDSLPEQVGVKLYMLMTKLI